MAMNVGSGSSSGDPEVMIDINTTPLIDVMLVLIIMLIITIPIQLHSVSLNMPTGTPPPPATPPVVVTIDIDFDGTVLWNGEALADRRALEVKLHRDCDDQHDDQHQHHVDQRRGIDVHHDVGLAAAAVAYAHCHWSALSPWVVVRSRS